MRHDVSDLSIFSWIRFFSCAFAIEPLLAFLFGSTAEVNLVIGELVGQRFLQILPQFIRLEVRLTS